MIVDDLLNHSAEWMKGEGPEGDVILSSRVRLARNLHRFPFPGRADDAAMAEIESHIRERLDRDFQGRGFEYVSLADLDPIDRQFLSERHLISRDHALGEGARGVAIHPGETASLMVNEEDHLRLQVLRAGLRLEEAWSEMDAVDSELEELFAYAFHSQYGYLTGCPTNVGTGMRISVLMHLPAVVFSKQMEKVLQSLQRLNYSVRGVYGEGTSPSGDLFQISNQVTLGKPEEEIVQDLRRVIPEVLKFERLWRQRLFHQEELRLEDRVWRAYGLLKNARKMASEEAMEQLSALRLGVCLGLVKGIQPATINELMVVIQPAHLQKTEGRPLEPDERDAVRATWLRDRIPSI